MSRGHLHTLLWTLVVLMIFVVAFLAGRGVGEAFLKPDPAPASPPIQGASVYE